jgi:hypothetical protein
MATSGTPIMNRRPLRFEHLSEASADILHLRKVGYERCGNWNLVENLDHINKAMLMSMNGPPFVLPQPLPWIIRQFIFGKVLRGEQVTRRNPTPKTCLPQSDLNEDQVVSEFERLANVIETSELTHKHPFFGKLSTQEWRLTHRWHTAHHLSFLIPKQG